MENHAPFPIIVLRIEIRPEESHELLEKQLLRINGVHQVAISQEKGKATIIGNIDPIKLVKYVAKMGKRAELVKYKKPKSDRANHADNRHRNEYDSGDKDPTGASQNAGQSGVGRPDDHPHCKVKHSFDREKYRSTAKDVEEETFRKRHGQFHSFQRDDNHQAPAKEFEQTCQQDQHGHTFQNHGTAPRKKVEEETSRDRYGQFHSAHNDKYHSAAKKDEEEICRDQYAQFHGGSTNSKWFVPPANHKGATYYTCADNHPHGNREDSTNCHGKFQAPEEMNHRRYGQFYGRSRSTNGYMPPKNAAQDAKYSSESKEFQEEKGCGGYDQQFPGRSRNANYEHGRPRYDISREAKIEEVIKEAKEDMGRFFNGIRGRSNDHFPVGSSTYHHDMPSADDNLQDRNPPPPAFRKWPKPDFEPLFEQHRDRMAPPHVYRGRSATRYDKFTNFFSDENPSSCNII